jgi:hypothetical protein
LSDEKTAALHELHDLIVRTVVMLDSMENMEHRVGTIVEGQRQQISHLVSDLKLPDMRAELRAISLSLKSIEKKL